MSLLNHLEIDDLVHDMKNYITISRGNLELLTKSLHSLDLTPLQLEYINKKLDNIFEVIDKETNLINEVKLNDSNDEFTQVNYSN